MLQNGGAETEVQLGVAFYVGSLLSMTKSGMISHYNLGHACYSQAQIELCLVLMLCFCSVHHRFYKFP